MHLSDWDKILRDLDECKPQRRKLHDWYGICIGVSVSALFAMLGFWATPGAPPAFLLISVLVLGAGVSGAIFSMGWANDADQQSAKSIDMVKDFMAHVRSRQVGT